MFLKIQKENQIYATGIETKKWTAIVSSVAPISKLADYSDNRYKATELANTNNQSDIHL